MKVKKENYEFDIKDEYTDEACLNVNASIIFHMQLLIIISPPSIKDSH
jgi:hypothetical protein